MEQKDKSSQVSILPTPIKSKMQLSRSDFELCSVIGKGAYAKVYKAKYAKDPLGEYKAIKIMEIETMERLHKLYQIYLECDILSQLSHPSLVNIDGVFEERKKIYIVLEYLSKGDFSDLLRLNFPLPKDTIKFYAAEIVNVLEYLQENKVIHRDLKPENIMLDDNSHLKLIDFATAKVIGKCFNKEKMCFEDEKDGNEFNYSEEDFEEEEFRNKRGVTFVGTAEYVSPEVLKDDPAGFGADIWALGIMIYQMYCGRTPFKAPTEYLIFKKIEENKIEYPSQLIPEDAKDLIQRLLVKDPQSRLGSGEKGTENDFEHLKSHPYFNGINFSTLTTSVVPNSFSFKSLINKGNENEAESCRSSVNSNNNSSFLKKESTEKKVERPEKILMEGTLEKKSPWFHYNTRKVILYSTPKLEYIDPEKGTVKGSIYLSKDCKAEHVDTQVFDLYTPKRSFKFKVKYLI